MKTPKRRHAKAEPTSERRSAKVVPFSTADERARRKVLGYYQDFTPRTPEQHFTKRLALLIDDATTTTPITTYELVHVLRRFTGLIACAGKFGPREAYAIVLGAEAENYRWPPK